MIYCLGSINADFTYRVPHLPGPGETLAATSVARGLGGKGANQSVAAALAGSHVRHIGAVGPDGAWLLNTLRDSGVDVSSVAQLDTPTGHAVICVDADAENGIILFPGANQEQSLTQLKKALSTAKPNDILLLQNESNLQLEAAQQAKALGMRVIYSAAPFCAEAVRAIMPFTDLLVMNEGEAAQLVGTPDCPHLITRGAAGADWSEGNDTIHVSAFAVTPVDTTGAGDCFIGYVAAGLDLGLLPRDALRLGSAAAALQIQRPGTAEAIPTRAEVDALLSSGTS